MKTTINKTVLAVCIGFLSIPIPLLFTACEIFEPYDKIYYHDVGAEGYAYYEDKPVPNVKIVVWNEFKSKGYATKSTITEEFISDTVGYFYVRFIRRTGHEDVIKYSIGCVNDTLLDNFNNPIYPKDILKSKEKIQLGRINLIRKNY